MKGHTAESNQIIHASWSSSKEFVSGAGSSNLGRVKSDTLLPMVRYRCNIFSKEAVLPGRNDAEIDHANSLHASTYFSAYNKRFDLILM